MRRADQVSAHLRVATGEPCTRKPVRAVRRGAAETGPQGNRADRPPYFQRLCSDHTGMNHPAMIVTPCRLRIS
jgi:hypothetical protein